jgi:hypothetical protein
MRLLRRLQRQGESIITGLRRWLFIIFLVLLLLGIGLAFFSPSVRVREIQVKRTDTRLDIEKIELALAPVFRRHMFFLSAQEIIALLHDAVPDLKAVTITKDYPSRLLLHITLEPLIARLSIEGVAEHTGSGTVLSGTGTVLSPGQAEAGAHPGFSYLTENGFYVTLVSSDPGLQLPLISVVDWGSRPQPGNLLIHPSLLTLMNQAEEVLTREFSLPVQSRTVFLRSREFHLRTNRFSLWFDEQSELPEQLARLRTFMRSTPLEQVQEYIDLRITGKVIYR